MNKKVAYNALINLLGVFFVALSTVLSTPYLIQVLGKDGFTVFRLILVSLISVTYLIDLGLSGVVRRLLGKTINKKSFVEAKKILNTINFLYLIMGVVAGIFVFIVGIYLKGKLELSPETLVQYNLFICFSSLYVFLLFFQSICNSILMIYEDFTKYQIVVSGAKVFQIVLLVFLLPFFESKLILAGLITIVVFLLFYLLSFYWVKRKWNNFSLKFKLDKEIVKEIKSLLGHNFIVSLCPVLIFYMNDFIVAANLSMSLMAIYTIAMLFTNQIKTIVSSMMSPLFSLVSKLEAKNESGLEKVFSKTLLISLMIWMLIVFPLMPASNYIVQKWVGVGFLDAVSIININLFSTIGLVFYLLVYNFLNATGKISKISKLSFLTVLIYVVLIFIGYFLNLYSLFYFSLIFSISLLFRGVGSLVLFNREYRFFKLDEFFKVLLIFICFGSFVLCCNALIDLNGIKKLFLYFLFVYGFFVIMLLFLVRKSIFIFLRNRF